MINFLKIWENIVTIFQRNTIKLKLCIYTYAESKFWSATEGEIVWCMCVCISYTYSLIYAILLCHCSIHLYMFIPVVLWSWTKKKLDVEQE